ncbi:MAG: PRC-barrel domain-containing protein [Haloferacaceae archaeon]
MVHLLASRLSGDDVMTTDGVEIGTLQNVTVDVDSGQIVSFLVDPGPRQVDGFDRNEEGDLVIPADRFQGRDDYLLVDRD